MSMLKRLRKRSRASPNGIIEGEVVEVKQRPPLVISEPEKSINRRKLLIGLGVALGAAGLGSMTKITAKLPLPWNKDKKPIFRIGFSDIAYAIAPDITIDGTDDHTEWNTALGGLPATGGKIIAYGGNENFGATVNMPQNNILIEGSGRATYIANNGSTPIFDLNGKTGIIFKDIRTDEGGITGTFGSDNLRINVWIGSNYYNDIGGKLPTAAAGGTGDVITANFAPDLVLVDQLICVIIASAANTGAVTFAPDGGTARAIKKSGGVALVAGDIPGANAGCILEYHVAGTPWWELLNPAINATNVAAAIVAAAAKTTPVGADSIGLIDSADSNTLKETTITQLGEAIGALAPVYTWVISSPAIGGILGPRLKRAHTCVRLDSYVAAATSVTFNIEERATIGSAGTNILASDQVADTNGETTTSFDNASLAADCWLYVDISAVSGNPGQLVISLACTV